MADFEDRREIHLWQAEEKGRDFMTESLEQVVKEEKLDQLPSVLPAQFAVETSDYSLDVKEDMLEKADNRTQRYAAEMISYETLEKTRKTGLKGLDLASEESEVDLSMFGLDATIKGWDSWISDFYREFSQIDYLQQGLSEHKMEDRNPAEIIEEVVRTDKWLVDEDDAGELYIEDIYVVNEDWIDYKRGKKPAAYDKEVVGYLKEIGVGS